MQECLQQRGWEQAYPLFTTVNRIVHGHAAVSEITDYCSVALRELPADDAFNALATDSEA